MPTVRPRYAITETDEVAGALALAAQRWPDDADRPSRLLLRLVAAGRDHIDPAVAKRVEARRKAIREAAGCLEYPPNYLNELREDWPE